MLFDLRDVMRHVVHHVHVEVVRGLVKHLGEGLPALKAAAELSISQEARDVCKSQEHRDLVQEFSQRKGDGISTKSAPTEKLSRIKNGKGTIVEHPLGVGSIVTVAGFRNVSWEVRGVTAETAGRDEHSTVSETRFV